MDLKPATRNYLIKNDRQHAEDVAGHNRVCAKAPACQKPAKP